jgi:hypothetical protein
MGMLSFFVTALCLLFLFLGIVVKSNHKLKDFSIAFSFLFLLNAILLAYIGSSLGESESNYLYIFTLDSAQIHSFFMFSLMISLVSFTVFILNKSKKY